MKKKIVAVILVTSLIVSMLAGCGQSEQISEEVQTQESIQTAETTELTDEPEHTHDYIEEITAEAGCESAGLKTFTCECGDSYTEEIVALGHSYENYVFNEDATYLADGTETAICNRCELTDTRTAEDSKLEYTYTDMEATMYAQQTVNVRDLPSTDGNKLGSLSTNDEVKVTGQADTGWYRIVWGDAGVAYVSNSYLEENKVEVVSKANSLANHFGVTLPFTATVVCPFDAWWTNVWNSPTSFNADTNYVGSVNEGTQVTISDLYGSKNDCMAYTTAPDGTSGWIQFSYKGRNFFAW